MATSAAMSAYDLTKSWPLGLSRRTWPLALAGLILALAGLAWFDGTLSRGATGWPEGVRGFFGRVTDYGLSGWILIPSLLAMLLSFLWWTIERRRLWRLAVWQVFGLASFVFVGVGLPGLVANLVKRVIGRARPELIDQAGPLGFRHFANSWVYESFPSGHSTTAIGIAFVIGFLVPRLFPPALAVGLLVGLSRIAIGMHYPSDVLAGAVLGMLGAYAVRNRFAAWRFGFELRGDGHVRRRPLVALRRLLGRRGKAQAR